jgi:hypothetical protein
MAGDGNGAIGISVDIGQRSSSPSAHLLLKTHFVGMIGQSCQDSAFGDLSNIYNPSWRGEIRAPAPVN